MKFPVANLSELGKIEAGIGFTSGIFVGALSSFVLIMFFTAWQWYFKVFSAVGSLGIIGSLYMSLSEQVKMRRNYIAALKEMESMGSNHVNNLTNQEHDYLESHPEEAEGENEGEGDRIKTLNEDYKH